MAVSRPAMSVDELDQCNEMVGKDFNQTLKALAHVNGSKGSPLGHDGFNTKQFFPFKRGYPFVATLRVGSEGIQMTVDGKHITSFAYREVVPFTLFNNLCLEAFIQSLLISFIHDLNHFSDFGAMAC